MANKTLITVLAAVLTGSAYAAERPHYFKQIPNHFEDEVDWLTVKMVTYNSMLGKYPAKPAKDFFNNSITVNAVVNGQNVEMIYKNYRNEDSNVFLSKKIVAHYTNQGREELSLEDFEAVKKDMVDTLSLATKLAYEGHSKTKDKITNVLDGQLKKDKVLKEDEKLSDKLAIQLESGLSVGDAMYIPDIKQADFVPKKFIYGPIPALGMCYLNSGWVYYDPKARILDYMDPIPNILIHECEHRNTKLQRMPFAFAFDAETWASLPIMEKSDPLQFLVHPYYEDVRGVSKVLFGFDSKVAFEKSFFVTEGGVQPDKKRLTEYISNIKKISTVIQNTALEEFIPEYYSHFSFWSTVNDKLKDKNAAFKLYMYMNYEPTVLGGAMPTRKWLEKNKVVIEDAAKEALENLKNEKRPENTINVGQELMGLCKRAGIKVDDVDAKDLVEIYEKMKGLGYLK